MAEVALDAPRGTPRAWTLDAAAKLWFAVTVFGQAVFCAYIVAAYAPSGLAGNFAAWNRHEGVPTFVPGDAGGNFAFIAHISLAALIALGGTLQFIPQIRARWPVFHRWNGRVFMTCAIAASLAGAYLIMTRGSPTGPVGAVAIMLNAALVLLCAGMAWRLAARRDFAAHRRWAMRAFMVTNGVFFLRLAFPAYIVLTQAPPPSLVFQGFSFASYLAPLAILELYFQAQDRGGPALRMAAAGVIAASALYMSVGLFGFTMMFALPALS